MRVKVVTNKKEDSLAFTGNGATRFDLEAQITELHCVADDIRLVVDRVLNKADGDAATRDDEISNALIGIETILRLRADKLFDTHVKVFKLKG